MQGIKLIGEEEQRERKQRQLSASIKGTLKTDDNCRPTQCGRTSKIRLHDHDSNICSKSRAIAN